MKQLCLAVAAAVMTAILPSTASAVIWGDPDDQNEYPFVGLVITDEGDPAGETVCSGVLLNPNTLLTAAHCVDNAQAMSAVVFGQSLFAATALYIAYASFVHPDYNAIQDGPDVAALKVVLVAGSAPTTSAQLPSAGALDEAAVARGDLHDRMHSTVGFGISGDFPDVSAEFERQIGEVSLLSVNSSAGALYAQFSANAGKVTGGACLGDSGGPVFASDGETVVGVNSFGRNANCVGTSFASRIDLQTVLDFIDAHDD